MPHTPDELPSRASLSLAEARGFIRRAMHKAEELHQRGAFVVVDDGGHVVSISRMDGAGPAGVPISRSKAFVAAVVTDRHGDILQLDRMDGAAPMTVPVAEGKALTALNFSRPSGEVAELYTDPEQINWILSAVSFKLIPLPGGLPIRARGGVIGAIGVSGADLPADDDVIARYAIHGYA